MLLKDEDLAVASGPGTEELVCLLEQVCLLQQEAGAGVGCTSVHSELLLSTHLRVQLCSLVAYSLGHSRVDRQQHRVC